MTWAKIDDRANENEKQMAAGAEASWLWVCGLMYCNRQPKKTGRIPKPMVGMLFPKLGQKHARKLVQVGLWRDDGDAYVVHNYAKWNDISTKRADAGRKGGKRSGETRRQQKTEQDDVSCLKQNEANDEAKTEANAKQLACEAGSTTTTTTTPCGSSNHDHYQPQQPGRVPCPPDLGLDDGVVAGLEISNGIPRWAALRLLADFALSASQDPDDQRSLAVWRKCALTAIRSRWSDPSKRPRLEVEEVLP